MSRSAQSLLPPPEAESPQYGPDLRPPAERVLLIAVWTGIVVLSLAFWATVILLCVT